MIKSTDSYRAAIIGDTRRMLLRAVIDIVDPDIVYGKAESQSEAWISKSEQLHDKVFEIVPYSTAELNRWVLDGTFLTIPESGAEGQIGYVGDTLSSEDGGFSIEQYVEQPLSNCSILQACSVYFPNADFDGWPVDFTVEVKQGGTAYYTKTFTDNIERFVSLTGFTVYNPDAIRVTVERWSLPYRRLRAVEIVPGIYEQWDGSSLATFSLKQQGNVACTSLPYGICTLTMDNLNRRFEPRSKDGLFQSIEERQGFPIFMGPVLEDGTVEYKPLGVFYQYSGGWKTGDNGLTMQWDLVDIIGLLASREFLPPDSLPTTLVGWIAALVAQLGDNFTNRYSVDASYAELPIYVNSAEDITGKKCGDVLLWACMATGTWPRADAETGYLAVEPLWDEGNKIDLDNLTAYPTIKANEDIAAVVFTLADGNDTQCIVSGNTTAASATVSVNNPFLHTKDEALTAAKQILSAYGGNQFELKGRGDPASEIGDVDTIWLNESSATTARRILQDLSFSDGVLKNCSSTLLQADGSFLFQNREILTESQTWTAPAGVSKLRVILVGGGAGGESGTDGTWEEAGVNGKDGTGAKVWAGTIDINEAQSFSVSIGTGGALATDGTATVFGAYSSANGQLFTSGYTDVANGSSFARSGVTAPIAASGDGGAGGAGGSKGQRHTESWTDSNGNSHSKTVIDSYPGSGKPGTPGASGSVVVYWEREGT